MAFRNILETEYDNHYEVLRQRYVSYLMYHVALVATENDTKELFLKSFTLLIDGTGLRYVSHLVKNIYDAYQKGGHKGLTNYYDRLKIIYC